MFYPPPNQTDYPKPQAGYPYPPPPAAGGMSMYGQQPMAAAGSSMYAQQPMAAAGSSMYAQGQPTAAGVPVSSANYHNNNTGTPVPWSTGLCDCFNDVPNCCITCWCPCITFGQIAEIVDKGSTTCGTAGALYALLYYFTGCACMYSCFYRSRLRQQYLLQESPCPDCLVHCFCEHCALCQEYRELQNHGLNLSLGWQGNVDRQNQGVAMVPIVEPGMYR